MHHKFHSIVILISIFILSGCSPKSTGTLNSSVQNPPKNKTGPPVIVYKTKKNYNNLVPVMLSTDKSHITSFPDVRDVFYNGQLAIPTKLENEYLLDNRGISKDVAFLSYTYEEYAKLKETPGVDILFSKIVDKDPVTEMYRCGTRYDYQNIEEELNRIIRKGKMMEFEKIK